VTTSVVEVPFGPGLVTSWRQCSSAMSPTTTLRALIPFSASIVTRPPASRPGRSTRRSRSPCQRAPPEEPVKASGAAAGAGTSGPPWSVPAPRPPRLPSAKEAGGSRMLTLDTIREAPKALLHDHLDGGLRPATVIDLAREYGHELPTQDVDELTDWFHRGADRKSLELYLETFQHTFGVMQERDAIVRVAAECAEDLAADGVVYAEVRMAPELCTERGLTLDEVQDAILDGFRRGSAAAAEAGRPIVMRSIVTAMRQAARSVEVAECAVRWRDAGVVGFDVAGPEKGYP